MMKKKRMRILKFETEKSALSTRKTFFFFLNNQKKISDCIFYHLIAIWFKMSQMYLDKIMACLCNSIGVNNLCNLQLEEL